jgi:HlyD family secretion protein
MKKLIGFVILLAAAGGGWWYYIKFGQTPEKATVNYASITQGDIVEAVTSTGTLEPERRFDVGSQVSGVVQHIYVDYNDIVRKGQMLAKIDPSLLQTQVEIRKAAIARQESDIASQVVQLEDQRRQRDRVRSLFEKGLQNQQQLEASELSVKTREAQIESAKKSLFQATKDLEQAELNVTYTNIIAPDDGVVVERRVDVGQTVQASMTTPQFFVLAKPLVNLRLTAQVDEAEIGRIRPGMEVRFTVEAYGQKPFTGYVDAVRLNAAVANNVVTYPVWIRVPNPQLELRPSMTASLRIIISTADDVVRVPAAAVRFRPNADIYRGLGLDPPAPGQGGRLGGPNDETRNNNGGQGGREGQAQPGQTPAAGQAQPGQTPAAGQQTRGDRGQNPQQQGNRPAGQQAQNAPGGQNRQPGQGGGRGGTQGGRTFGGQGFGRGGADLANMTPEQRQALMRMTAGRTGGRGGNAGGRQGGGARGQGAGARGQGGARGQEPAAVPTNEQRDAGKIDELWAPVQRQETRATVWKWDEAKKELTQINVRLGVSDGSWNELLAVTTPGVELKVGDQLVTGVILPASMRQTAPGGQQSNPFANPGGQQRGMPGGGMPPGGGGGGNPGGGRGGGGGGGRGGN